MTEFQAAIGRALLPTIEGLIRGRKAMVGKLRGLFAQYKQLRLPGPFGENPWSTFPVLFPSHVDCEELQARAHELGLQVRRYYFPTLNVGYNGSLLGEDDVCVAEAISKCSVCFPVYDRVSDVEFLEIATIIARILAEFDVT